MLVSFGLQKQGGSLVNEGIKGLQFRRREASHSQLTLRASLHIESSLNMQFRAQFFIVNSLLSLFCSRAVDALHPLHLQTISLLRGRRRSAAELAACGELG